MPLSESAHVTVGVGVIVGVAVEPTTIVFASSFTGFLSRSNQSESYYKEISRSLAESCVELARLELATDPLYDGDEPRDVGDETCQILPIETPFPPPVIKIIKTTATFNLSGTLAQGASPIFE